MNYRIAILTDSDFLQAWEWECINFLIKQEKAEVVLEIRNLSPKSAGEKSGFLYRAYRALDRVLFKSEHDAFCFSPISTLPIVRLPQISVTPLQSKYKDGFQVSDLERIKEFNIDIILRFGFRILTGEILTLPRLGVWSYHHGDPSRYRGGPPAFWEVMLGWETTGTVLQRLTEELDQGNILYQSWSQTDPLSVQRNANNIFWKSSYFVARVLDQIVLKGEENWLQGIEKTKSVKKPQVQLLRPPSSLQMLGLVGQLIAKNLKRKVQEKRKHAHWEIAWVDHRNSGAISSRDIQLVGIPQETNSYFADPFPVSHEGKTYLFAERFDKETKKGTIVCGKLEGNVLSDLCTVISEDWHLSYPFVVEQNDGFFMVPESAEAGKLYLYHSLKFPYRWERKEMFFEVEGYDPTVYKSDDRYWLFVNQKSHPACSSFDELHLYWCESLEDTHWKPHPMNPIVSDVRCSRPAGKLFERNGKLFRPAQDSGQRYGHRIAVQEVLELSETSFLEKTAYYIEPELVPNALGVHSLNFCEDNMFLDFYFRK